MRECMANTHVHTHTHKHTINPSTSEVLLPHTCSWAPGGKRQAGRDRRWGVCLVPAPDTSIRISCHIDMLRQEPPAPGWLTWSWRRARGPQEPLTSAGPPWRSHLRSSALLWRGRKRGRCWLRSTTWGQRHHSPISWKLASPAWKCQSCLLETFCNDASLTPLHSPAVMPLVS